MHKNLRVFSSIASALIFLTFSPALRGQESTTVGGYGELHYNEPDGPAGGTLDFHRFVLYLGHSFNENLAFKSEVEIEHTKLEGGEGGELAIEQAFLDWHFCSSIGLRAGILLPPVGIINQIHEPPTFNGVERPNVDRLIIPATWRESGAGIVGSPGEGLNYQLYVVAGLKAEGFDGANGIRGGRQEALESSPMNPSLTGRLDYVPFPGLKVGGSFFFGNTTGGDSALGSGTLALFAGDVQYTIDQLSLRAEGAMESIGDAGRINAAFGNDVADQIYGYYIEGAYDMMSFLAPESEYKLSPFIRYEKYNTQSKVTGFTANPLYDRNDVTIGATLKPTYNTAFKIDYQFLNNAADANAKVFNVGVGYSF
jgi:hypothetical protein